MSRESYSLHYVLSATLGAQILVADALHAQLICWADTDPNIAKYTVETETLLYVNKKGIKKEVKLPLIATSRTGHIEHWDTTWAKNDGEDSISTRIKRAYAEEVGAAYRLFNRCVFEINFIEAKNRMSVQRVLYDGKGVATEKAECRVLMELVEEPLTLTSLTSRLGINETFTKLAVFRLWLKGHVLLPMNEILLQQSWIVRRSGDVDSQ